jgi:hypothetical protein
MTPEAPSVSAALHRMRRRVLVLALPFGFWLLPGCLSLHREPPRPGLTEVGSKPAAVPAHLIGNALVVETKWDSYGPYRFLIDTGSSSTLLTPELVRRYAARDAPPPAIPEVPVRSASGASKVLTAATVERLQLGAVRFERVPVLIYDCADLSDQLGVKIDGILGFPLFRETILTLDYPHERIVMESPSRAQPPLGDTMTFDNQNKAPFIWLGIGDRRFSALIDSGSDGTLSVNEGPAGPRPKLAVGPTEGPTVGTLAGEYQTIVGRLAEDVTLGSYVVPRPVVEIDENLPIIGGGILKQFTITFDPAHSRVTFYRDSVDPVSTPPLRSTGLSFRRTPAYWRVSGVIPGSSADGANVQLGDLVTRVNGEPVSKWDLRRYNELVANGAAVDYTFLENGKAESSPKRLKVVDLVP